MVNSDLQSRKLFSLICCHALKYANMLYDHRWVTAGSVRFHGSNALQFLHRCKGIVSCSLVLDESSVKQLSAQFWEEPNQTTVEVLGDPVSLIMV